MAETIYTQVQRLQKEFDLPPLATDEEGNYIWPLDEESRILLGENEEEYTLYSAFTPCPTTGKETFFTKALRGNLFGQGTAGAVLGLTPGGDRLLLQQEVPKELGYEEFEGALEEFLNTIEMWRSEASTPDEDL